MSRGYPSMTALLGLLAIAGTRTGTRLPRCSAAGRNPILPRRGKSPGRRRCGDARKPGRILGGAGIGEVLSGGLRELMDAFKQQGRGEVADSWVASGPTSRLRLRNWSRRSAPRAEALAEKTGLSREEILSRLSKNLPEAVDKYTPQGRIPSAADFS